MKEVLRVLIILLVSMVMVSCGDDGSSESCPAEEQVIDVPSTYVVKRGVGNVEVVNLRFLEDGSPVIIAREGDNLISYTLKDGRWESSNVFSSHMEDFGVAVQEGNFYFLIVGRDKLLLYVTRSTGGSFLYDLANSLNLAGNFCCPDVAVENDRVFVSFVANDSKVFLGSSPVTMPEDMQLSVVEEGASNGTGYFTGKTEIKFLDSLPVVGYFDGGASTFRIAQSSGNSWTYYTPVIADNDIIPGSNFDFIWDNHGALTVFEPDTVSGSLLYFNFVSDSATPDVLDPGGRNGEYLGAGRNDDIMWVIYSDTYYGNVKIAYLKDGSWKRRLLFTRGISGILLKAEDFQGKFIGVVFLDIVDDEMIYMKIPYWELR